MATLKAARHALRIADKIARRKGGGYVSTTRQGRGFGVAIHDPNTVSRMPSVVAGVPLELHERKRRRHRRTFRELYADTVRRRPRRRRRPKPEEIAGRLVRYEYDGRTGTGRYVGAHKRRRERARFKRRQRSDGATI